MTARTVGSEASNWVLNLCEEVTEGQVEIDQIQWAGFVAPKKSLLCQTLRVATAKTVGP